MYFDTAPKSSREDLFGMSYILDSLISNLNNAGVRMIAIKGLRRTGKTSLLNVALSETKAKHVKIDVREAAYYDKKEFVSFIVEKIKSEVGESIIKKILEKISGVELSYKEASTVVYFEKEKEMLTFFEKLNSQLKERGEILILAFDEAQLLSKIKFDYILASIYDNYKNIKFVLTGSEIGLMDEFLGKRNAESPLFGRAFIEIETKKLESEQISQFLIEGFAQIKKKIDLSEIKDVVEIFDGIIGWATYYGWLRGEGSSHEKTVAKVIEYGGELVKRELENFLANRNRSDYLKLLKWVAGGYDRWGVIKAQFIKDKIKISDRQLDFYLKELADYGFIEKRNENYFIADPLLIRALK